MHQVSNQRRLPRGRDLELRPYRFRGNASVNIRRESGSRQGNSNRQGPAADLLWHGLGLGDPGESLGGEAGMVSGADQRGPGRAWQALAKKQLGFYSKCVFSRGVACMICLLERSVWKECGQWVMGVGQLGGSGGQRAMTHTRVTFTPTPSPRWSSAWRRRAARSIPDWYSEQMTSPRDRGPELPAPPSMGVSQILPHSAL